MPLDKKVSNKFNTLCGLRRVIILVLEGRATNGETVEYRL